MKVAFLERTKRYASAPLTLLRRRMFVLQIMIAPSDGTQAAATKISGDFGSRCFMGSSKVSVC
jgi:hypothetical protein